jgi:hypothetical protein
MREADDDYVPEKKSGGNTALIIVLVIGGVFLVVALVCGGLGYYAFRSFSQVMQTAMAQANEMMAAMAEPELFFQDIAAGSLDAAYGRTSKGYQARTKLEDFKKFVETSKLKNATSRIASNQNYTPQRTTAHYTVTAADGTSVSLTIQVVKEGEQWRVDSLTVP